MGWLNTVETVSQEEYWKSLRWYNDLLRQHEAYVLVPASTRWRMGRLEARSG